MQGKYPQFGATKSQPQSYEQTKKTVMYSLNDDRLVFASQRKYRLISCTSY